MERRNVVLIATTVALFELARGPAMSAEFISIKPLKLIIVDKLAALSSAKAVYVAKDDRITKGSGTDPATISAELDVYYGFQSGFFVMPAGAGWLVNTATVAEYVNQNAPSNGATKVTIVKPGKLLKSIAKSLGDTPIDISSPLPEFGNREAVVAEYYVRNGEEQIYLCGAFLSSACSHKSISGGTGWKLVCRNGVETYCRHDPCSWTPCGAFVD